ncbi:MAG: sugar ABC transporter substrate-binding protein [Microbacterium sp. SCN 70-200]|uniref:ABC transporter substrate-binding protein n=1 Tax=unclassified Microbacterium TaxID=2609290 RepID=UPI00086E8594|nr:MULTISPECIES: extracellular solute-binding protein [unclassified Microbacterium]MBN9215403.1 extracellular solute-binding protein [Microbacterium sp.]ODT41154.1 MAG: sugar ABC transporter substrate-binding protein [Microbacterium sp. SCN 70-200]OJV79450.1 MAG: sugar ABC transporter substrate-binding protein [Microbacterium sp. 70-16]
MNRKFAIAGGLAVVTALSLAACSGTTSDTETTADGPVTLTLSGWSIDTTPEFQLLADGFEEATGNKVEVVEYDPAEYNTLLTADLGAGAAPDIITQKEVKYVPTLVDGGQLLDVSDIDIPASVSGADSYSVDGVQYGTPYRQDSWVLFYNKDIFDAAGVDYPDGSWTWDDYDAAAAALTTADHYGTYEHRWQSTTQGFANAQFDGDIFSGDYSYMTDLYERRLAREDAGYQIDFATSSANSPTYQGEFGKQHAAMLPMGTWYVATLLSQQASGEADTFNWGFAPIPQVDSSTIDNPVTFGDPTGFGINAAIAPEKVDVAKQFLEYAFSDEAAAKLAAIGITPANTSDAVVDAYFAVDGVPTDDVSKFAWSTHDTRPENPTSNDTAAVQTILGTLHTEILTKAKSIDQAIADAEAAFKAL